MHELASEKSIFLHAAGFGPAERDAFLDRACASDPAMRTRIAALLAAHDRLGGDTPPLSGLDAPTVFLEPVATERPGVVIAGRYRLVAQIGEGGMGTVWMAEQTQPVKRQVAVKLIKPGMDSKLVLARFEAERQALALMDHPNIAKVHDAGAATDGRPFFVMELVRGVPITRYCDEHRLTPRQRLELLVPVCQAVQHAHQKGIIHRDLKPSNVLVGLYDEKPVPKVIDFGVAKAAGVRLTENTLHTTFGAVVGTVEYMSPEQATFNQLDVDTRSDVYALGVLLYELLTGTTPLDRVRRTDTPLVELLRMIREDDTVRPSARLSAVADRPAIAARRGVEPRKLSGLVRGELDWIVMKALEKDRNRRYETPNALAADLNRYLADEVVGARPPSASYRVRKFTRRHGLLLATAAGFVGLLLAGAAVATWQAVRATRAEVGEADERRKAERNELMANDERNKALESSAAAKAALKEERFTSYTHRVALAHREWLAGEVASAKQLLGDCPADLRDWEWRYVRRLCNSELLAFRNHTGAAFAVAFSPDGRWIASASRSEVRVWEAATGKEAFRLPGTNATGVSFRPDGKHLAVAWAERVTVYDAAVGKELLQIQVHDGPAKNPALPLWVTAVAYSPDGKRLATVAGSVLLTRGSRRGGEPAALKIWDSESGQELLRFVDPPRPMPRQPTGVAFSPDGSYLAVSILDEGADGQALGEVHVRDAADGRLRHTLPAYPTTTSTPGVNCILTGVAFSADSRRVGASGSDAVVRVWELPAGRPALTLMGPSIIRLTGLAFSPAGDRVAVAGSDRVIRIWDTSTGKETDSLLGHSHSVYGVAFSPDGRRIASAASEVRVWDATTGQQARVFHGEPRGAGLANRPPFSPDGRFLALVSRSSIRIRDLATGEERRVAAPTGPDGPIGFREMTFSPDGTTFATTAADGVRIWDVARGAPVRLLPNHPQEGDEAITFMDYLAFSPDGRRLAAVGSSILTIWETATGQVIHKLKIRPPFDTGGGSIAYSPDGRRVAVAMEARGKPRAPGPTEIKMWDVESGQELTPIPGGGRGLAYSPDGTQLASGNLDGTVTIRDAASGAVVFTLRGHTADINDVAFSPDGRRLVSAGADMTVRLWDPSVGKEVLVLRGHAGKVVGARFSPDGHYLASVCLGQTDLRLWDARPVEP